MTTVMLLTAAAIAEIAGCFAFWAWWKLDKSALWLLPGATSLIAFALLLSLVESPFAGRIYAGYGGIYVIASLLWLWFVEGMRPDRWDLTGAAICLIGAIVILAGPRVA